MSYLLDTSVVVGLLQRDDVLEQALARTSGALLLSVVSAVELEAGVLRADGDAELRRRQLNGLMQRFQMPPFDADCVAAYARIVGQVGFSRRKVLDRMIAAQALVHGAALVTLNPRDFADVPSLAVVSW